MEVIASLAAKRRSGVKIYGIFHSTVRPHTFKGYTWNPGPQLWEPELIVRFTIDCDGPESARDLLNELRAEIRTLYAELGSSLDPELPAVIYDVTRL